VSDRRSAAPLTTTRRIEDTTMTQLTDITDSQIETLCGEAAAAGDFGTCYLARIALGETGADFTADEQTDALAFAVDVFDTHTAQARAICASIIREAAAQR
jgi:hypothetical protein